MRRIDELAQALAEGTTTSRELIEDSLARIQDPDGEGARAFIKVHVAEARTMADAADSLRRANRAPGPYAGIPIALKDLFDIAGEPTPAGSAVLADAPDARANAPVVARMLAAGFIPVGRTNMTEFAFSGLGINPHYGTPSSPWDRTSRRIPGGSSSGTGVAVADGMAAAGLGTDTGGSCRIPAAFCGIVGYKRCLLRRNRRDPGRRNARRADSSRRARPASGGAGEHGPGWHGRYGGGGVRIGLIQTVRRRRAHHPHALR